MGKATVVSHIGEGRYLVDLDYGKDRIDERIQKIDEQIAQLVTDETAAAVKLAQAQAHLAVLQSIVNEAIEAYRAAVEINPDNATQVGPMVEAAEAAIEFGGEVAIAQLELSQIQFAKGEAEKDKTALQAVVVEEQKSVWCADYTTTASGTVATHEVPGEPSHIIIAPAGRAPGAGDGQLLARGAMTSAQAYFNAAILPGWQKFKPTHRIGTISNINEDADTCTVTLEDIKSSAQNLGVNDRTTLSGVPVQYMTCHAKAFTNGERVLVEFAGQDWSAPKVVGFADGPKQCPHVLTYSTNATYSYLTIDGVVPEAGNFAQISVKDGADGPVVNIVRLNPMSNVTFVGWSDGQIKSVRQETNVRASASYGSQWETFPAEQQLRADQDFFTNITGGSAPATVTGGFENNSGVYEAVAINPGPSCSDQIGVPTGSFAAIYVGYTFRWFGVGGVTGGMWANEPSDEDLGKYVSGEPPEIWNATLLWVGQNAPGTKFEGSSFGTSISSPSYALFRTWSFTVNLASGGCPLLNDGDSYSEVRGATAWDVIDTPNSVDRVFLPTGKRRTYVKAAFRENTSYVLYEITPDTE